jgi:hypothetical protein
MDKEKIEPKNYEKIYAFVKFVSQVSKTEYEAHSQLIAIINHAQKILKEVE